MSLTIVDKRSNTNRDRTTENRGRFLRRIKDAIQEQLPNIINGRTLKDMDKSGGNIRVNRKTISEPQIHHTDGGNVDRVLPGNDQYVPGDLIEKPKSGGKGRGKQASNTGEGEDDFIVELTREEFLEAFFEGLELPDMLKTQITKIKEYRRENAGFQPDGPPNRLSVQRSYKQSFARRLTLTGSLKFNLEELEKQLFELKLELAEVEAEYSLMSKNHPQEVLEESLVETKIEDRREDLKDQIFLIEQEIEKLLVRIDVKPPMFEEIDLRYRSVIKREIPVAHATMIMIMDNSGSMGEKEKTIARKFFWLLYSFLRVTYEKVDMRFISHTTEAREMEEEEFFNTRENGGTVVSTALELTAQMIRDELLNKTNIYVAQVSDGDNYETDNGTCSELLEQEILPYVRYMAYVQVDDYHGDSDAPVNSFGSLMNLRGLWKTYQSVSGKFPVLQAKRVYQERDIYQVFRDLFKKKE